MTELRKNSKARVARRLGWVGVACVAGGFFLSNHFHFFFFNDFTEYNNKK
jgi:hypothetical protein